MAERLAAERGRAKEELEAERAAAAAALQAVRLELQVRSDK